MEFLKFLKQAHMTDLNKYIKYSDNNYKLYHGETVSIMKLIPDDNFNCIFSDPPYNLSNDGITCQNGQMIKLNKGDWDKSQGFENDVNFHRSWITECFRILKPGGSMWVSGTYHSIYQCGYIMQEMGFWILNNIVWYKPNASPNLACTRFTASDETIIWATKPGKDYTFNYDLIKYGELFDDPLKKMNSQMRSVWCIPTTPPSEKTFGFHPTQKPRKLLDRIVLSSTNIGDSILDPFNGSGTTGVTSLAFGREYTGIDLNEEYLDLTKQRIDGLNLEFEMNKLNEQLKLSQLKSEDNKVKNKQNREENMENSSLDDLFDVSE